MSSSNYCWDLPAGGWDPDFQASNNDNRDNDSMQEHTFFPLHLNGIIYINNENEIHHDLVKVNIYLESSCKSICCTNR